jgi:tripartite-type tricarboxylate transporter receptor subunit TctC
VRIGIIDFTPLGLVVEAPRAIIAPKNFPANTLAELIAYVKANKNMVKYGSAGAGSASHVSWPRSALKLPTFPIADLDPRCRI